MKANKKFKDSMFTKLFSTKENILELYNAIEGTNFSVEDTEVELETLENILFMGQYNDVAFLLNKKLIVLAEHQSTFSENFPIRILQYIGRTYEKLVDNKALYHEKLIKIPTPEFYVFYNGPKDKPLQFVQKLSTAFYDSENPKLELEVKILNINHEKHNEVLKRSTLLDDYSYFVYKVRSFRIAGIELESAIEKAINECIAENRLKNFLEEHKSEVANMLYAEFDLSEAQEAWEKNGVLKTAAMFLDVLSVEEIAERAGLSLEEVKELKKQYKK